MKIDQIGNKNAYILTDNSNPHIKLLQSYRTQVAAIIDDVMYSTSAHYSATTDRHIRCFAKMHGYPRAGEAQPQPRFFSHLLDAMNRECIVPHAPLDKLTEYLEDLHMSSHGTLMPW